MVNVDLARKVVTGSLVFRCTISPNVSLLSTRTSPKTTTGTVRTVVFDLAPRSLGDELALHEATSRAALAQGAAG